MAMTTVQVRPETKEKLNDLKLHPRETYDELIDRLADAAPARTEGSIAWCNGIVVFGSQRISQIASTINGMMGFMLPVAFIILLGAFLTTAMAYFVLVY